MNKSLLEQLSPTNCQVIFIDHQPQMAFGGTINRSPSIKE